jgi:hypothetical protein
VRKSLLRQHDLPAFELVWNHVEGCNSSGPLRNAADRAVVRFRTSGPAISHAVNADYCHQSLDLIR